MDLTKCKQNKVCCISLHTTFTIIFIISNSFEIVLFGTTNFSFRNLTNQSAPLRAVPAFSAKCGDMKCNN